MQHADYEQIAAKFDQNKDRLNIPPDNYLAEYLDLQPQHTARVLDVGCGTGNYLQAQMDAFAAYAVQWHGLEPSSAMLTIANRKTDAYISNGRSENLPYPNHTFDYVAINFAFHHVSDKEKALDEMVRVLKPGGLFRMQNLSPEQMAGWWIYHFFPETCEIDEKRFWSNQRILDALRVRGVTASIDIEEETHPLSITKLHEDVQRRDTSQLAILPDDIFQQGADKIAGLRHENPDMLVANQFALLLCMGRKGD